MRKTITALLLLFAGGCMVQALEIQGETKFKQHRKVVLWGKGAPESAALIWDVSDEDRCEVEEQGGKLYLWAPPGKYTVKCRAVTIKEGKAHIETARKTIEIEADIARPLPPPEKKADPEGAIGKLRMGNAGCTATVIYPRRGDGKWDILTAAHCTRSANKGTVTLASGKVLKVSVAVRDTPSDICWLVTDEAHEELPYAHLAKEAPPVGTAIWHRGHGIDRPGNKETGKVTGAVDKSGMLWMAIKVSSGDSGCGLFRGDTNEVVATLYGTSGRSTIGGSCVAAWRLRPKEKAWTSATSAIGSSATSASAPATWCRTSSTAVLTPTPSGARCWTSTPRSASPAVYWRMSCPTAGSN